MQIPDEAMIPAVCPACAYPLTGLPEPRCPECGERIEYWEVVLIGTPAQQSVFAPTTNSWPAEMAGVTVVALITGAMLALRGEHGVATPVICGGIFTLGTLIVTLRSWYLRSHGFPPGVLRISSAGYRFGAGASKGRMNRWSSLGRVEIKSRGGRVARIRGWRTCGPIALYIQFDIVAPCSTEQAHGLAERLRAWALWGTVICLRGF